MPVFWITINPIDLQYPLIIRLANVEHELFSKIQSAFYCKIATINSIAIAKFFHIIYNAIFMSLFAANQIERRLLGPILNYFTTLKVNSYEILYLHCFV